MMTRFLTFALAMGAQISCSGGAGVPPGSTSETSDKAKAQFPSPVRTGLCEVRIGMAAAAIPVRRQPITVHPEGIPEERSEVRLCEGRTPATLAYDEEDRVRLIIISVADACLDEICVGESYGEVRRRHPHLRLFASPEEGGQFYLISEDRATTYGFDFEGLPGACFEDVQSCATRWDAVRVSGFMIGAPLPDFRSSGDSIPN